MFPFGSLLDCPTNCSLSVERLVLKFEIEVWCQDFPEGTPTPLVSSGLSAAVLDALQVILCI